MSVEKPLNESRNTVPASKVALANSRNSTPTHSDGDLSACKRHTVAVHPNHSGAGSKDSSGKKAAK